MAPRFESSAGSWVTWSVEDWSMVALAIGAAVVFALATLDLVCDLGWGTEEYRKVW